LSLLMVAENKKRALAVAILHPDVIMVSLARSRKMKASSFKSDRSAMLANKINYINILTNKNFHKLLTAIVNFTRTITLS
jgi:hypothetical protein